MSLAQLSDTPGKVETVIIDAEYQPDPLAVYQHLCRDKRNTLLLESAEIDSKDGLKSLILVDAALRLECSGNSVSIRALSDNGRALLPLLKEKMAQQATSNSENELQLLFAAPDSNLDEDSRLKAPSVFNGLRSLVESVVPIRDHDMALFLGGAFAYDLLAGFEPLREVANGHNTCPDYVFYLAETLVLIDHKTQSTQLLGSVYSGPNVGNNYFAVSKELEQIKLKLDQDIAPLTASCHKVTADDVQASKSDAEFIGDVNNLKEHILAGDIFQVVPSRTFSLPCPDPYQAYAELKRSNPSPYMFYMQDEGFAMFGASPESALKYGKASNEVEVYPIAGTRPRGKRSDGQIDPDLDSRIELNLREDEKEKAEHLMLVDLARNDIARVSEPGSRSVRDLLKVDRYSHVMHLVSRVVGQLRGDLDALHAYQACMNMGTLVGAPKVSAAELIREVEGERRGSYGGAVGYLNGKGDMDTCIVIRSAFVKDGTAHIQAGAGVVYDSDPQAEADETRGKAQAVISAIINAHSGNAQRESNAEIKGEAQ